MTGLVYGISIRLTAGLPVRLKKGGEILASLNQEVRERMAALRGVVKIVKSVVTAAQAVMRLVRRLTNRRKRLPDEADLQAVLAAVKAIIQAANELAKLPSILADVWRI